MTLDYHCSDINFFIVDVSCQDLFGFVCNLSFAEVYRNFTFFGLRSIHNMNDWMIKLDI